MNDLCIQGIGGKNKHNKRKSFRKTFPLGKDKYIVACNDVGKNY